MSLTRVPGDLSNPSPQPWAITVIAVLVVIWRPLAEVMSVYADAMSVGALIVGCGTAAKYSNLSNRSRSAVIL
ncbi:hypothetical protein [Streptomyces sp. NBC_01481]|uniref:hypothetical protein n=1 Tax=Streptomyces sp. NBC_01481 TaxID=2975869 RepID=UPI0022578B4E|nr:hypothetical protein [Streptomyces sp. NBC_01481]MCX4588120.1 hypothetical protein [Streptomyces sp. NBC_01481]